MAVYVLSGQSITGLAEVACDNNSGADGADSVLSFDTQPGTLYLIVVDGVGGATGTLELNYNLVVPSWLEPLGWTAGNLPQLRISSRPNMAFVLEDTVDFIHWTPILTTNSAASVLEFTAPALPGPLHFYRARMLP